MKVEGNKRKSWKKETNWYHNQVNNSLNKNIILSSVQKLASYHVFGIMYCKTSVFHSMNLEISNFLGQLVKPKFLFLVQKPKFLITTTQFLRQKKSVQQFFSNHNFYFLVNMVFYTIINMVIYCFSMLFTSARFFFFPDRNCCNPSLLWNRIPCYHFFHYSKRFLDFVVKIVDHMKDSHITGCKEKFRKIWEKLHKRLLS